MKVLNQSYSFRESPNKSSRPSGTHPDLVVVHFTASQPPDDGDISWLCDPRAKASAHFVISRSGRVTQLVELDEAAWHAGVSQLRLDKGLRKNLNATSIGVELDNVGPVVRGDGGGFFVQLGERMEPYRGTLPPAMASLAFPNGHVVKSFWEPYPEPQLLALDQLLVNLEGAGYAAAAKGLVGHDEIAVPTGRKLDPGPLFPWKRYAQRRAVSDVNTRVV